MRSRKRNNLKLVLFSDLNLDIYEQNVLPKLLNIIINSKDKLSQEYLMECIIHAFPDSGHILFRGQLSGGIRDGTHREIDGLL